MKNNTIPASILVKHQKKEIKKAITYDGMPCIITVKLRYDDKCGNGHNSFSITGSIDKATERSRDIISGCIHEEIIKHLPEFEKYVKWHLCGSDGPMYYLANTLYQAGDRDYNGKAAGEPDDYDEVLYFGNFPISFKPKGTLLKYLKSLSSFDTITITAIEHKKEKDNYDYPPKFTFTGYTDEWYECPFDTQLEAEEFLAALKAYPYRIERIPTSFSKGKERELDSARRSAIWPEVSDETLSLPKKELETLLIARLPSLMREFKAAMEEIGFTY